MTVLFLELDHLPEKVQPGQGWLSPLPTKCGLPAIQSHPLADERIQYLWAHAVNAFVFVGVGDSVVVKAVGAMQVAIARGRLDQQASHLCGVSHIVPLGG